MAVVDDEFPWGATEDLKRVLLADQEVLLTHALDELCVVYQPGMAKDSDADGQTTRNPAEN